MKPTTVIEFESLQRKIDIGNHCKIFGRCTMLFHTACHTSKVLYHYNICAFAEFMIPIRILLYLKNNLHCEIK